MPLVLGYHGCDIGTARKLLGGSSFSPSKRKYDWLGAGSYFWENDAVRAYQWACEPRRKFSRPSLVGAVIELGNCLDLTTQVGIEAVKVAYDQFIEMANENGTAVPENMDPPGMPNGDKVIRYLDCAVINHLFDLFQRAQESDPSIQPRTTVRALFPEGGELYPGAGFRAKTHIQLCVRDPRQILGVFRIPEWQRKELKIPALY
jgi:hypothetical protein